LRTEAIFCCNVFCKSDYGIHKLPWNRGGLGPKSGPGLSGPQQPTVRWSRKPNVLQLKQTLANRKKHLQIKKTSSSVSQHVCSKYRNALPITQTATKCFQVNQIGLSDEALKYVCIVSQL